MATRNGIPILYPQPYFCCTAREATANSWDAETETVSHIEIGIERQANQDPASAAARHLTFLKSERITTPLGSTKGIKVQSKLC